MGRRNFIKSTIGAMAGWPLAVDAREWRLVLARADEVIE
jgi:hypothetical protein